MFESEQVDKLKEALKVSDTFQRAKGGLTLTYIEGWHAIAEANEIFGHGGWQRETLAMTRTDRSMSKSKKGVDQHVVSYLARVRVTVWAGEREVIREGYGSGTGYDQSLGAAHESAVKEAETDAMKRALMTFGWRFGLALYDKTRKHVSSDPVNPERVSGKKGDPLIEEFMRLAAIIGKDKGDSEWAYATFLSWKEDGKDVHAGIRTLEGWQRKELTPKHRRWLEGAVEAIKSDFPELASGTDEITDKDIPF